MAWTKNPNNPPHPNWGGARPGSGRKLQPSGKGLSKMRRYLEVALLSDFRLMAHLALRPDEFKDQVLFGGTDETDKDGKTKSSGGYFLDPLFKERLSLLKFRLSKFLPDAPREVEVNGEMTTYNLHQLVQQAKERILPSMSSTQLSTSQPTEQKTKVLQNGSASSLVIVK